MAKAKQYWPDVKEFFFDDDTFNIQKARTVELCAKLKPLGLRGRALRALPPTSRR